MKLIDLIESFDAVPDRIATEGEGTGRVIYGLTTGDDYIEVEFTKTGEGEWEIGFRRNSTMGISGEGNAFNVFGVVIYTIKQFLKNNSVDVLTFLSQKLSTAHGGYSRTNLYKSMVKRFAHQYGFEYYSIPTDDDELFVIKSLHTITERSGSPLSTSKTLYHGTTLENAKDALQHGIWASVGDFVSDMYGNEDYDHEDLVFAADKEGITKALTAMAYHVAKQLKTEPYKLTSRELYTHGALLVIKNGAEDMDRRSDEDEYWVEHPPAVEPDDYYSRYTVIPDYLLTGKKLRRFVTRLGLQMSYQSGIMHPDQQQNLRIRKGIEHAPN